MTLRYLDLFSGISAPHVAFAPLGWECAAFAEVDPFACALLAHRYPDVPNLGDVTKITKEVLGGLGRIDLVVGGSPCQDWSTAGRRAGLDGNRAPLAFSLFSLAALAGARWVIWENVPGLFSQNKGDDFRRVLAHAVDECGYRCAWRVLDARHFGVPQRRRRVFLVGHSRDWRASAAVLLEPESLRRNPAEGRKAGPRSARGVEKGARGESNGAVGFIPTAGSQGLMEAEECSPPMKRGSEGVCTVAVAFGISSDAVDRSGEGDGSAEQRAGLGIVEEASPSLRARGNNSVGTVAVAFDTYNQVLSPETQTLKGASGGKNEAVGVVAIPLLEVTGRTGRSTEDPVCGVGIGAETDPMFTLQARHQHGVGLFDRGQPPGDTCVRRLSPVECERLMGLPDAYTLVPWRKGLSSDGPRYKALGNSMVVPVVRWIGARISLWEEVAK